MFKAVVQLQTKSQVSLFKLEDKEFQNNRAGFNLNSAKMELEVWAKDAVAFKTIFMAISRVLVLDEKTSSLINKNG